MFEKWADAALEGIKEYGLPGLFVFSATEAIFHPIPVDPVIVGMMVLGTWSTLEIFLVATISSVIGGSLAHYLGRKFGKKMFLKFFPEKWFEKGKQFLEKYGMWSIVIAAATPIPFKVMAWMAGILHMPFWKFFIAQAIGRAARFAFVIWGTMFVQWSWPYITGIF